MRKLGGIAVLVAVLAVSGCAAGAESNEPAAMTQATEQPSAAPITMEPTEGAPDEESTSGEMDPDEFFLRGVANSWHGELPSDDELLGAAKLACEQIASGTASDDVVVVEGDSEDAVWNNGRVVTIASQVYCPA